MLNSGLGFRASLWFRKEWSLGCLHLSAGKSIEKCIKVEEERRGRVFVYLFSSTCFITLMLLLLTHSFSLLGLRSKLRFVSRLIHCTPFVFFFLVFAIFLFNCLLLFRPTLSFRVCFRVCIFYHCVNCLQRPLPFY